MVATIREEDNDTLPKITTNVRVSRNKTVCSDTFNRLIALKPVGIFLDEFLNNIIDHYIGTSCKHKNRALYLKLHVQPNGCLDSERCFQVIRDAHFGQGNPDIVEVCEDCLRMKRIFRE